LNRRRLAVPRQRRIADEQKDALSRNARRTLSVASTGGR